jgi:hypothetical protein
LQDAVTIPGAVPERKEFFNPDYKFPPVQRVE